MPYEILTIASADLAEKEQQELSKKIQDLVKKDSGKVLSEANLGTKKFAYPMKKQETGTYLSLVFELPSKNIKSLKKELTANEQIIRVFIFKTSTWAKKKAKVKKAKAPKAEVLEKTVEIKKEKETTISKTADVAKLVKKIPKKVKPTKKPAIAAEIEDEEDRLKKLDEKLDEILKE